MDDYTDSQQLLLSPTHLSFPQVYKDAARCTETFERWQAVTLELPDWTCTYCTLFLCGIGIILDADTLQRGLKVPKASAVPSLTLHQPSTLGVMNDGLNCSPISPGRGRGWSSESEAVHTPSDWSPPLAVMERRQGVRQPNIVRVSSECDGRRLLISVTTFGAFLLRAVFSEVFYYYYLIRAPSCSLSDE